MQENINKLILKEFGSLFAGIGTLILVVALMIVMKNWQIGCFIALFSLFCFYFYFDFHRVRKNSYYIEVEAVCNGKKRTNFGYGMTYSNLYEFSMTDNNVEELLTSLSQDEKKFDIQLSTTMKFATIIPKYRNINAKYQRGETCNFLFKKIPNKPFVMNNNTLLAITSIGAKTEEAEKESVHAQEE